MPISTGAVFRRETREEREEDPIFTRRNSGDPAAGGSDPSGRGRVPRPRDLSFCVAGVQGNGDRRQAPGIRQYLEALVMTPPAALGFPALLASTLRPLQRAVSRKRTGAYQLWIIVQLTFDPSLLLKPKSVPHVHLAKPLLYE